MAYFVKMASALLFAAIVVSGQATAGAICDSEKIAIAAYLKSVDTEPAGKNLLVLDSRTIYYEPFSRKSGPKASKWMPKASRRLVRDFLRVARNRDSLDDSPTLVVPSARWRIVDSADLDRMFDAGGGWTKFHAECPAAAQLIRVSRAGIDEKSQQVLFLIDISSGPVSGAGFFVLLRRIKGEWQVLATERAWIS